MEAASLSLQHGGDHATSDNAQPPSPRTFLAVSPPQIGMEACPRKGWEKEREILQLQAELEFMKSANAEDLSAAALVQRNNEKILRLTQSRSDNTRHGTPEPHHPPSGSRPQGLK